MSLILVYHDRARAVIASDDRAHCEDGAGIKHRLPGRHPKFVVLHNGLCFGCVGRTEHTQRLLRGTLRMASENDLNFDALAVQLHFAVARIWSQRLPATLCVDKLDAVLCGFDSRQQRIRSVFWLSDRGFMPVETTNDPNNRSAAIGAFEAEDEVLLQRFTDRMRQASGKGHCWIALQMRKTIDQISERRPEVIGLASYFAAVNKHGLTDLPAEFPLPPSNPEPESMGAACGAGRMFVGSITTPNQGAPQTTGNADGGAGAQVGNYAPVKMPGSVSTLNNGTVTNPQYANDGNPTTGAVLDAPGATPGVNDIAKMVFGAGIHYTLYSKAVLNILYQVTACPPPAAASGLVNAVTIGLSVNGGASVYTNVGVTSGPVTLSIPLPDNQTADPLVTITADSENEGDAQIIIYEAWTEIIQ